MTDTTPPASPEFKGDPPSRARFAVLATALAGSICGITYELLCATVSSYFLGNAVLQYSLTIGVFLFAMGIGSWLSGKFNKKLVQAFIIIEIAIGFTGGFATLILFAAYRFTEAFSVVMYGVLLVLGILIGLEVPLLIRILRSFRDLRFSIADVLSFDYVGALFASILFPLVVLPYLGMMHASFFYGIFNMVIVFLNLEVFGKHLKNRKALNAVTVTVTLILITGFITSSSLVTFFETKLYDDEVIFMKQTRYTRIVMTRYKDDTRLFMDGNLQFSSWDEYRYHESLVIPAMSLASNHDEILILGGGDGMAAREVFKYPDVKNVTLVDIDGEMVELCKTDPMIKQLNKGSLEDPKMNIVIEDAFKFINESNKRYDVIIADLPDPNNESLSKLYSRTFYNMLKNHLSKGGMISIQSTSPYFARTAFWCVVHTVESVDLNVEPYHVFVPSFGDWGFTLASNVKIHPERVRVNVETDYLDDKNAQKLFVFGKDEEEVETETNTLNSHKLLQYYEAEWRQWE